VSNNKKIKAKTWFLNWFKYFEAYLELARIGLLQLDEQKYPPETLFKKDAMYGDQILLIPIIWSFKHSIELLLKSFHIRITQEFSSIHDNMQLHNEIKTAFINLGITDPKLLEELIILSEKYFKLKFWSSFVISNSDIYDDMNDIFRYPESRVNFSLNIEELHKVTIENKLELKKDFERLNKLSLKLYSEITTAKVKRSN
jgi:hypothetical protein